MAEHYVWTGWRFYRNFDALQEFQKRYEDELKRHQFYSAKNALGHYIMFYCINRHKLLKSVRNSTRIPGISEGISDEFQEFQDVKLR